ncbi:hypothetical protein M885DRAFT_519401 [Pelagophyceae sp. CCMP2097]|nr:hypothetical protein M885DRAFT_519401 [Pelagophyceae sp. CCMP2097]
MPATNKELHDKRYYADGVVCAAPQKITAVVDENRPIDPGASQSKWNTNDYHWEERDLLEFARGEFRSVLLSHPALWSDARSGEALKFVSADVEGHVVSNVRKGRRLLTYALQCSAKLEGSRSGAGLVAALSLPELAYDDPANLGTTVDSKTVQSQIDVAANGGCDMLRAMKTHEMLRKLVDKKAKDAFARAVEDLVRRLNVKGGELEPNVKEPAR